LPASHFAELFDALEFNQLLRRDTHLLTGYVPNAESLQVISSLVDKLRAANPNLFYVLDPVMGDDGRMYVNPDVVPVYKTLAKKADLITPNDFEAECVVTFGLYWSVSN
jgi:pyridoxine kinase